VSLALLLVAALLGGSPVPRARAPEVGVACPVANSTRCDRVGVAVWLRGPAASVTAWVQGRRVALRHGAFTRDSWGAYVRHAGVRRLVGRDRWAGDPPRDVTVRVRVVRRDGGTATVRVRVALRAGWG
jgi:hypothetical protein